MGGAHGLLRSSKPYEGPQEKFLSFKCCGEEFHNSVVTDDPLTWLPVYQRCSKCKTPYALYPSLWNARMVTVMTEEITIH